MRDCPGGAAKAPMAPTLLPLLPPPPPPPVPEPDLPRRAAGCSQGVSAKGVHVALPVPKGESIFAGASPRPEGMGAAPLRPSVRREVTACSTSTRF